MLCRHGRLCWTRGFLFFTTFLLIKFLLILFVSSSIIEVEAAVRDDKSIENYYNTSYKGNEDWRRKGDDMKYFASAVDSKLEKVKVNANEVVKSESGFKSWWRERPSKEDVGFIWGEDKDQSKPRARKKKKRKVKTHDHKFAILHTDL